MHQTKFGTLVHHLTSVIQIFFANKEYEIGIFRCEIFQFRTSRQDQLKTILNAEYYTLTIFELILFPSTIIHK